MIVGLLFELASFAGARVLAIAEDSRQTRGVRARLLLTAVIGAGLSCLRACRDPNRVDLQDRRRWLLVTTSAFAFLQPFRC